MTGVKADGDELVVLLGAPAPLGATLTYGPGLNPSVGIVDASGFPVPLFGPVAVG